MILDLNQIKSIIVNNPGKALVSKGVEYNKTMRLHIYGDGLKDKMGKIEGYESEDLRKLRVLYARSNKDLFSRLGRPIDKVFSARGGSVYYNLSESQDKTARTLSLNVRNGYSIKKWVECYWKPHMLDDPFGLTFMEIMSGPEAVQAKKRGESLSYPTYKAITAIYDYLPKGSGLEYVVFNVSKAEKLRAGRKEEDQIYRVVDDAQDYWILRQGDEVSVIQEYTYPNFFMSVPGILNSDIVSPENEDLFKSFYDEVIELANHFMLYGSIRLTHQFLHGYPKYWEFADTCNDCGGAKTLAGETCSSCKGTGKKLMTKVSDAKLLDYPDKDNPTIAPDVAGYVSPDKTYYEISTAELQMLEELMNVTLWGSQSKVKTMGMQNNKQTAVMTATEIMDDIKPEADRLQVISEMAEKRHKFILDSIVNIQIDQNYSGSSVNYGRRYMIEGPDEIWKKYSDARVAGAAMSVLDDLLNEYYEAKFSSDPVRLAIQTKLMKVEPFVHTTPDKVDLMASVTQEDKSAKVYFSEWLSTINEAMVLSMSQELLRENLLEYAKAKAEEIKAQADQQHQQQLELKQTVPVKAAA